MSDRIVVRENLTRTSAYRKDEATERALGEINRVLAAHEPDSREDLPPAPHLFVFGLPRSGTTLAHQVLAWALDVGYVTNVMARFWLAPRAGAVISRAVLGDTHDGSFASDYGKSVNPSGGHEFAYFWHHWLGIHDVEDLLDFSGDSDRADWAGCGAAVRRIREVLERPLLFKTNYAAQFLPAFARTFPMPLFVHVRRDPLEVALSILEARRRYYGDVSSWWATYPPDYPTLVERPLADQIAGQVVGLRRAYERQCRHAPELVVELDYEDLCASPGAAVELVRTRCRDVHGTAPELLNALPERFDQSTSRTADSEEERSVVRAVKAALAEESA